MDHRSDLSEIAVCLSARCSGTPNALAPIALCGDHLRKVYDFCQSLVTEGWAEAVAEQQESHRAAAELHRATSVDCGGGWVYFVVIGPHIKIGWTSYPKARFKALRPDEVLHVQPGSRADERRLHAAFAHLLDKGREWFRDEPELRDFISGLHSSAAA